MPVQRRFHYKRSVSRAVRRELEARLQNAESLRVQQRVRRRVLYNFYSIEIDSIFDFLADDGSDPLSFRPNLSAMDADEDELDQVDREDGKEGVYKISKASAVMFDEEGGKDKEAKKRRKALEKAKRSKMLEYIARELSEAPEVEDVSGKQSVPAAPAFVFFARCSSLE